MVRPSPRLLLQDWTSLCPNVSSLTDRPIFKRGLLSEDVSAEGFAATGVRAACLFVEVTESVLSSIRAGPCGASGSGVGLT